MAPNSKASASNGLMNQKNSKPTEIRKSNMRAAKALSDAIRTSLGPKGMDKMIQSAKGDVTITNDGATILAKMMVVHPAAKMLVELSQAQDIEAGDGTTSVVVLAGSLLDAAEQLLNKGIHPTVVSDAFQVACEKSVEYLEGVSIPISIDDRESLLKAASTSLNSKVVSNYGTLLAQIAVDAVLKVKESNTADLKSIRVMKLHGGTVEDTELIDGLVLEGGAITPQIKNVKNAKIGLIQFCLSPPKTDMDNQVIVKDYAAMDRVLKEERAYLLDLCKKIKKAGCNVVLIQKSILRDAISDMAIHFLGKLKIMAIKDIERDQIEHISRTLNCVPIASIDHFEPERLGSAESVDEENVGGSKIVKFKGIANGGPAVSVIVRGSNNLVLDEAERSLHDALCVIRCLVKSPNLIVGGGAPETELAVQLMEYSKTLKGADSYCVKAYAQALEVIPYTLAENAGLDPIRTVTELRQKHRDGDKMAGINVRKGTISSMKDENVLQPFLVSSSEVRLASETVRSILKIDDVVNTITDAYLG